jgi:hypothetical protein
MLRPASFAASAALAALSLARGAHAQDRTAEVDRIFSAITSETPGCAVGVSQQGKVVVNRAHGLAGVERKRPLAVPKNAAPAAPPLDGLAGEYEVAPGRTLATTVDGGRLHGQPSGSAKRALTHVSGTAFAADGAPITLTFTLGADGRATALVMRQNGNERTAPRVK